jgi:CheY-like chemotaxis protein
MLGETMEILIVEDDKPLRDTFVSVLSQMGYHVTSAENGVQALERIRERRPSFIFVDLVMPVMNGFELIETLKADSELCTIPLVAMTASGSPRPPGVGLMRKPFGVRMATDFIRAHCADARQDA